MRFDIINIKSHCLIKLYSLYDEECSTKECRYKIKIEKNYIWFYYIGVSVTNPRNFRSVKNSINFKYE